jgi:hypothetical protein
MADQKLLAGYREIVEKRLSETIELHARVDPNVNLARMVDRQIAEELSRLKRLLEKEETRQGQMYGKNCWNGCPGWGRN